MSPQAKGRAGTEAEEEGVQGTWCFMGDLCECSAGPRLHPLITAGHLSGASWTALKMTIKQDLWSEPLLSELSA